MTTEQKLHLLGLTQKIVDINKEVLTMCAEVEADGELKSLIKVSDNLITAATHINNAVKQ